MNNTSSAAAPTFTLRSGMRRTTLLPEERRLAESIASEHGIRAIDLLGRARYPRVVRARHHFIAVLRWSTFMSYPDIAALVGGGLDHTTVIAAERRYDRELNGESAPIWRLPVALRSRAESAPWGCPKHPEGDVWTPRGREPRVRFCHVVDRETGIECGERIVSRAASPGDAP